MNGSFEIMYEYLKSLLAYPVKSSLWSSPRKNLWMFWNAAC